MRNLTKNIASFSLVFLTIANANAQKLSKIQKRNKNQPQISYGSYDQKARSLFVVDDSLLIIGNPDGAVYLFNMEKNTSKLLFKKYGFNEVRDIEKLKNGYILMHSGKDGKFTYLDRDFKPTFDRPEKFKNVFFNSIDFEKNLGVLVGDPVNSNFSLYYTLDFGKTWNPFMGKVPSMKGESSFASSGTSIEIINDKTFVFISGGTINHFFKTDDFGFTWKKVLIPFFSGELSGAFSVAFANKKKGVIVGGDYMAPNLRENTCYFTKDGGESWYNSKTNLRGYRSCVVHQNGVFYACGTLGIDYSTDGGKNWKAFADGNYYKIVATDKKLIATVKHGKIQIFDLVK